MIEQKLISDICRLLRSDEKNTIIAFQQCKLIGFLRVQEAMQISNIGFPVYTIIGTVLGTNPTDARNRVVEGQITYDDLLCILGIFAQDLMKRNQQKY